VDKIPDPLICGFGDVETTHGSRVRSEAISAMRDRGEGSRARRAVWNKHRLQSVDDGVYPVVRMLYLIFPAPVQSIWVHMTRRLVVSFAVRPAFC
jgi:hypothetical protein